MGGGVGTGDAIGIDADITEPRLRSSTFSQLKFAFFLQFGFGLPKV
jgi:hypothetical protein